MPTSQRPSVVCSEWLASTCWPARRRSWLCATVVPIRTGSRWTCSHKPSTTKWRRPSCLCPDAGFIEAVAESIQRQLGEMPRRDVIEASLSARGALIKVKDLKRRARSRTESRPNTWSFASRTPKPGCRKIRHAGAVFVGEYSSEALGDYCAGPNHVLPTARTARFSSPLGVYDFQKRTNVIQVSRAGARKLGPIAAELATGEGLPAHARCCALSPAWIRRRDPSFATRSARSRPTMSRTAGA